MILTGCQSKKIEGAWTTDDIIEQLWPSLKPAAPWFYGECGGRRRKSDLLMLPIPSPLLLQSKAIPYQYLVIIQKCQIQDENNSLIMTENDLQIKMIPRKYVYL